MTPGTTLNRLLGIVPKPCQTLNVIAVIAHGEKWVWIYETGEERVVLQSMVGMASNPELSFTHYDAGMTAHKMRQVSERKKKEKK
jgi:hypothetical protein